MTSPVMRSACSAVTSAIVPLVNSEMLDAQVVAQRRFQLLVERAAVGEDFAVPDLLQVGHELLQRRQGGLGDVDRLLNFQVCCSHVHHFFSCKTYHGMASANPSPMR